MKVLVLDLESTYLISGHWSLWGQNISINQIIDAGSVICWAASWLGSGEVVWRRTGNKDFLTKIHELLEEADAIMTYNGRRFDLPLLNREFVKANLSAPAPYKHIDLLETVKKQFRFPSSKLDWVCKELDVGQKTPHEGWGLWSKCREEDVEAWAKMKEYNIQDIVILEKLHDRIKPWILNYPNQGLYEIKEEHSCTTCGSAHLQKRGFHVTGVGRYQRYFCSDCGSWSRARTSDLPLEERKVLLSPL